MRPLAIIVAFLFLAVLPLGAQPYGFLNWSVAEGLPQSQVDALVQDDVGYLWVGTRGGGLARFDGEDFQVYTVADGLADNFVVDLYVDPEGQIYVLTRTGYSYYDPAADGFVTPPFSGTNHAMAGGGAAGAKKIEKELWGEGNQTGIAYGNTRFELKVKDGEWVEGELSKSPVRREASRVLATVPTARDFVQLPDGNYVVGSYAEGLFLIDGAGEVIEHYTEDSGDLPHNSVQTVLLDRQERVWLGTSGGGLVRMIPTGMRYYGREAGLRGRRVYALHEGREGRLWIGSRTAGIQYLDSSGFQRPPITDPTVGTKITSITQHGSDNDYKTYFGTDGKGITVLDSNRVERITRRSGLPSDWILRLVPGDKAEGVWAITYTEGLALITPEDSTYTIKRYGEEEGVWVTGLSAALQLDDGSFLLGGLNGGVQRWNPYASDTTRVIYGEENGLPPGRVSALATRRSTQLWVSVLGYGTYYTDLRSMPLRFFPLPNRLRNVSTNVFQMLAPEDAAEVWLGTERGVYRVYLNANGQPDYARHYGRPEGFLGGETTSAAALEDASGDYWFGTMNGLVAYREEARRQDLAPPPTVLTGVDLFYDPLPTPAERSDPFPARENHFNFRFVAVDLTYPDRVRYRYRLEGLNNDWSPLTTEGSLRFAGLNPGAYTFEVAATTDGGKTFGEPAEYSFRIDRPLVGQAWFLGLLAIAIAGILIGGFYYFFRRVQRRESALRSELERKNQFLELEQKALQLQMNPHFIFNALNGIRGLVAAGRDAEASDQLTRFATLMRGILNHSRQETLSLAEEVKTLRDYLELEDFCQSFSFTYTLSIPPGWDPEEISLPTMLLQPFVENAILHGLAGRGDDEGHIQIDFDLRGRRLHCTVTDNGIGRAAAAERQRERVRTHKSVALDVTRSRVQALGGTLAVGDAEGGGTRVVVVVPVETW